MKYWLFKSEPEVFSWAALLAKGKAGEEWTGVRNYQARNHMRAMAQGDRGFFYHSGDGKEIVGTVEIAAAAHADSTDATATWDCVDIRALTPLPRAIAIGEIKANRKLADMVLVKNSRLSVQPVTAAEWAEVRRLASEAG
jgi:predicted RNA-binding protein with PUA-like domain